jgi:20S proteasome subunit beta 1
MAFLDKKSMNMYPTVDTPGQYHPTGAKAAPSFSAPLSKMPEHMMGTTIMAVAFDGGVVVGADSRTTRGSYIAGAMSDKIDSITDKIFCCRSGSAADTAAVSHIVQYYINLHSVEIDAEPTVHTVATMFKDLCYQNKDRLSAGIIVGGYDKVNGGCVYTIPLGGVLVKGPYALGGSGSTYLYGYVDANYKPGMTKDECKSFVCTAISHAMARDGSSGGVVRMVTVTKDGAERVMIPGDSLPFRTVAANAP